MEDPELAAKTHDDILVFLQESLPPDVFRNYGNALALNAEGLFQWVAVASQFILDPPGHFGYSKDKCINHLLRLNINHDGQDPLDKLYKELLEGYFTDREAQLLFCSVVGQLITSIEPLSIFSLITLQEHTAAAADGGAIVILLHCLGSLLTNVNSSDHSLPIIPLHTSFRDFLTNKEKSGDFYVDLHDAHHQMANSCLSLLLSGLKFNICNLETSYLANEKVADLQSHIAKHIPPALLYSCCFWDDHLEHIGFETGLSKKLQTFFKTKFLLWLEALSLTNHVGLALPACLALKVWLTSGQGVSTIQLLIWQGR